MPFSLEKQYPGKCPLCSKMLPTQWRMVKHLVGCFVRLRKLHPATGFAECFNLFARSLQTGALSQTQVVDLLRMDFMEEIKRCGRSDFLGDTYFVCSVDENCKYRCLEKYDMNKHKKTHLNENSTAVTSYACGKCKKRFFNKYNYDRHSARKTSCI